MKLFTQTNQPHFLKFLRAEQLPHSDVPIFGSTITSQELYKNHYLCTALEASLYKRVSVQNRRIDLASQFISFLKKYLYKSKDYFYYYKSNIHYYTQLK